MNNEVYKREEIDFIIILENFLKTIINFWCCCFFLENIKNESAQKRIIDFTNNNSLKSTYQENIMINDIYSKKEQNKYTECINSDLERNFKNKKFINRPCNFLKKKNEGLILKFLFKNIQKIK